LLPHQRGASDPEYNRRNPAATSANAFGPLGTGAQFAPGSATSSRPLYEMQSIVPPPIASTPPDAADDDKAERRLGVRIGKGSWSTVFDVGAPVVPFASPNPFLLPGRAHTFNERYPAPLSPADASPGTASRDDLEAFRRQWLKSFMEP
jgi:hypothetical protein